ncbi:hypothetical protein N8I77_001188 [Diaporthe amygdali]|uniref:RRM domain-containing protein n=1 Tax=Phomopsis amygdali TaxID=1214568 RepID=A0AAD9SR69_PHOAM|nr:hypothetical protein N8I77_001188 [Diaporthe amygdali]
MTFDSILIDTTNQETTMSYHNHATMASDANNQGPRHAVGAAYMAAQGAHDVAGPRGIHYPASHHDTLGGLVSSFGALGLANNNVPQGAAPVAIPPSGYMPTDASVVYSGYGAHIQAPYNMGMAQVSDSIYGPGVSASHYMHQSGVPGGYGTYMVPYTPGRAASYGDRIERGLRDLPGLDNRRGSYSTTATESTPGTPFFGGMGDRHSAPRVISADRSSYTTPSPQQLAVSGTLGPVNSKGKRVAEAELRALVDQEPVILPAVPAVFTTPEQRKTLDQCLENRIEGNKNVYIRGLHPTTDDELLLKYASRFGEVEQSKAIIDTTTGACKGFGFAKFKNVRDSEKCIQAFYLLGYEVGFARESFNARLKAEGDDESTNLYISNLPKSVTEAQLVAIFDPYQIISSKILRDSMGNSRGVGFARFESREVCEEVIKRYHGQAIGDECFLMQVRYADTPSQKELKRVTAERRQYRTNEYNIGAYGTMAVGINPSIYNTQPSWGRTPRFASAPGAPHRPVLTAKSGNTNMAKGRIHQQSAVASSSDDGSADEGVTIVDSPTNHKSQSSPIIKKEAV